MEKIWIQSELFFKSAEISLSSKQRYDLEVDVNQEYRKKDYRAALAAIDQLIRAYPHHSLYYSMQGNILLNLERYSEAKQAFQCAIVLDPHEINARMGLAQIYLREKKFERVAVILEEVLNDSPYLIEPTLILGTLYLKEDMFEDAQLYFKEILKTDPQHARAQQGLYIIRSAQTPPSAEQQEEIDAFYNEVVTHFYHQLSYSELVLEVQALTEKREYLKAIALLQEYLVLVPDSDVLLLRLGNLYTLTGNSTCAEETYKQLISINPRLIDAYAGLADLYVRTGRYQLAIQDLKTALKIDPKNLRINHFIGNIFLLLGEKEKALPYFHIVQTIPLKESDSQYYYYLGYDYFVSNELNRSETAFERSLALNPTDSSVRLALARIYLQTQRVAEALRMAKIVLNLEPENQEAYQILGDLYSRKMQKEKAAQYYKKILTIQPEPKNVEYLSRVGKYYLFIKNYSEAQIFFCQALNILPEYVDAVAGLANIMIQTSRPARAIEILESFLWPSMHRRHVPEVEQMLGDLYFGKDNPSVALLYYAYALEDTPVCNAEYYFREGRYYLIAKERSKSERSFKIALQIDPEFIEAQRALADVYLQEGYLGEAKEVLERIIQRNPSDIDAIINLGNVYTAEENSLKARECYAKILTQDHEPLNSEYLYRLGRYYQLNHSFSLAQQTYVQALELDPKNIDATVGLAEAYLGDNQTDRAIKILKTLIGCTTPPCLTPELCSFFTVPLPEITAAKLDALIAHPPQFIDALQILGDIYSGKNEIEKACYYYNKILESDPNSWGTLKSINLLNTFIEIRQLVKCKKFQQAIERVEALHEQYPLNVGYITYLGDLCVNIQNYPRAAQYFRRALELSYNNVEAWKGFGELNYYSGNVCAAKKCLHYVLEQVPDDSDAHQILGDVYKSQGYYGRAVHNYSMSILENPLEKHPREELAFICHDALIDVPVPNSEARSVISTIGGYSRELGKNLFDDNYGAVLLTKFAGAHYQYYLNRYFNLISNFDYQNVKEMILTNQALNFNIALYSESLGLDFFPNDNWTVKGRLGVLRGVGDSQQGANFLLVPTTRFNPSLTLIYENETPSLYNPCPPPRKTYYATLGMYQETIYPMNAPTTNSHLIDVAHEEGSFEYRFIPPYTAAGIHLGTAQYKDSIHNKYRELLVWIRSAVFYKRLQNIMDLRFEVTYRGFNEPTPQYYSYKSQIIPQAQIRLQKIWRACLQGDLTFAHGWQITKDLTNPLQTAGNTDPIPHIFLNRNNVDGHVRYNYRDKCTFMLHVGGYWDQTHYYVFTTDGKLSISF